MRLTLTVVDPFGGGTADVVLDADPESTVGDIAQELANRRTEARENLTKARQLDLELIEKDQNKEAEADLKLIELQLEKLAKNRT